MSTAADLNLAAVARLRELIQGKTLHQIHKIGLKYGYALRPSFAPSLFALPPDTASATAVAPVTRIPPRTRR